MNNLILIAINFNDNIYISVTFRFLIFVNKCVSFYRLKFAKSRILDIARHVLNECEENIIKIQENILKIIIATW